MTTTNEQAGFYLGDPSQEKPQFNSRAVENPIDLLEPGSEHHNYVLEYLKAQIKLSEDEMCKFYDRWQVAERKFQAYLSLPNYEQILRDMNNSSKPPAPAIILFPYKFATISTIVTYCMKVFCGKKPFFPLGANGSEAANLVNYMEAMVQYQNDQTKAIARLFQLLLDGELYGLGVLRCMWTTKRGRRTIMRKPTQAEVLAYANNPEELPKLVRDYEERILYAGSELVNIDPFMFFPDPNVPIAEVSEKGEFVYWREFVGKHILLRAQAAGDLKYVDKVQPGMGSHDTKWSNLSHRSALTGGQPHAGENLRKQNQGQNNTFMVDQGSVEIIPSELGLGDSSVPEKWLFTILNKTQIVQAEPLDLNHGRHPIEVSEPYTTGYGFGNPSMSDYLGPIQDIISWFIDSRIYNVRATLHNQWIYDPSKIEGKDLDHPKPGKRIRLKPLAFGTDVRTVISSLPVQDVTTGHMNDVAAFLRIGDMVSSVNDPMRGVTNTGGRKTATENRMAGEAGGSRLGVHAQLISQQAIVRIVEQMVINIQQFQDAMMWIKVIGREAFDRVGADLLTSDFTYPVHDGSVPLDKIATQDLWKEILMGMMNSPVLSQTHSLPKVFEHVCTLFGAPNITSFRLVGDAEMDAMAKAGNAIPLPMAAGGALPPAPGAMAQ